MKNDNDNEKPIISQNIDQIESIVPECPAFKTYQYTTLADQTNAVRLLTIISAAVEEFKESSVNIDYVTKKDLKAIAIWFEMTYNV